MSSPLPDAGGRLPGAAAASVPDGAPGDLASSLTGQGAGHSPSVSWVLGGAVRALPSDAEVAQAARTALDARLDAATLRRAPASLAAVVHRGRVVEVRTHGEPRRDGAATREDTVFRIASMSKSFLAAAALSLRDEGLLDLHAPVTRYVPELASAEFEDRAAELTLDLLLSNRGGLAEDNAWGDRNLGLPRDEMSRHVADGLRLSAEPGTVYQYSNLGVSIIGRAIEAATGAAVEDVIEQRVLTPLGLSSTRSDAPLYPEGTDLAAGFRTFDDGITFAPEPYAGCGALGCIGSLFSTAADVATWMHFLGSALEPYAFGVAGTEASFERVLSARSRREMQTARTLMSTTASRFNGRELEGVGYAYGLIVEQHARFGCVVQHAGGLPGFSSHMRWHPVSGVGVVVLGNSDAFEAGSIAGDLLESVLSALNAPSAVVRPWDQTLAAAQAVDAAVRGSASLASLAETPELVSPHLLADIPARVRDARLASLLETVGVPLAPDGEPSGALVQRIISAPESSTLRWGIPCQHGTLLAEVHLVGLRTPLLQGVIFWVAGAQGALPAGEPISSDWRSAAALSGSPSNCRTKQCGP